MEGSFFRQLHETELFDGIPRLQALARPSPEAKTILVEKPKALGEIQVVGVTGDYTDDGNLYF